MPEHIYSQFTYTHVKSIIAVEAVPGTLWCWNTDGDIEPERVALLLSRYYATRERVELLFEEHQFPTTVDKAVHAAVHLHPHAGELVYGGGVHYMTMNNFVDAVSTNSYVGKVFLWKLNNSQWQRRMINPYSKFPVINPHEE